MTKLTEENIKDILKAGEIVKEVKAYARTIVKLKTPLLEIAEKIESKIIELGGKPAFPTNLSINEIAAHSTPKYNDETLASGLIKVDFGVQINGWAADNAFSLDLENSEENKKLIETSEKSLKKAIETVQKNSECEVREIGKSIEEQAEKDNLSPIVNLSGHSMEQYDLHAGITIPNIDNSSKIKIENGLYAIEPFITNGQGKIKDGKPSGIYQLTEPRNPRSQTARDVLDLIVEEYKTLPFCSRWIINKIGTKALLGLRELENQGVLHQFNELVEISKAKVAQTENTILVQKGKVTVTTENY